MFPPHEINVKSAMAHLGGLGAGLECQARPLCGGGGVAPVRRAIATTGSIVSIVTATIAIITATIAPVLKPTRALKGILKQVNNTVIVIKLIAQLVLTIKKISESWYSSLLITQYGYQRYHHLLCMGLN